eukprot:6621494-Alexandrium_andersonii.AAC.1
MTLGVWTAVTHFRAGNRPADTCPWCGQHRETWAHLWWQCERFSAIRAQLWPFERPPAPEDLPKGLANSGLCPQLFPGPGARWWPCLEVEGARWPDMNEQELADWVSLFGQGASSVSIQQLLEAIQGTDDSEELPQMRHIE